MGSAASCLTVPVESAPERQTKSLPRRWSSAAWQEEKLAPQLSPMLFLQPDDAPRDAGDDERWRALDEELTAEKHEYCRTRRRGRHGWRSSRRRSSADGTSGRRRRRDGASRSRRSPSLPRRRSRTPAQCCCRRCSAAARIAATRRRRRCRPSTVARALARPSVRPAARRSVARALPRVARSARGTAAAASCRSAATGPPLCRRLSACRALPSARLCSTTCRRRRGRRSRSSRRESAVRYPLSESCRTCSSNTPPRRAHFSHTRPPPFPPHFAP